MAEIWLLSVRWVEQSIYGTHMPRKVSHILSSLINFSLSIAFAKLSGHMIAPRVFLFDRINRFLVSGGDDTIVKIWDLRNTI